MIRKGDRVSCALSGATKATTNTHGSQRATEAMGRVDITPTNTGLPYPPVYAVRVEWLQD
jgi:hypothetical protein